MSFGLPDYAGNTPVKRLSKLLQQLDNSLTSSSDETKRLVKDARAICDGIDPYMEEMSMKPPPILNEVLEQTSKTNWRQLHDEKKLLWELFPVMCSGGYEAAVLQMFAKMTGAQTILEIGMFTSTSTIAFASLPQVKKVVSLDIEPYLREFCTPFWEGAGIKSKIDSRIGDARETLHQVKAEGLKFDMCFIDADKEGYEVYFKTLLDLDLLVPHGVMILDNTLYKCSPWAPHPHYAGIDAAIHDVNKLIASDTRVEAVMLHIRDGVTIARLKD